jgi:cell division protein FtsI/penicillin-binding protein 2
MLRGPDARLRLISVLLVAVLLPIAGKLLQLQVLEHGRYAQEVQGLVERRYALPAAPTGCVRDRHGDLLVGNVPVYDVGAEIQTLTDPLDAAQAAIALAPLLGRSAEEVRADLTLHPSEREKLFVWRMLAKGVPVETAEVIARLDYPWISLQPTWSRYYAEGDLAAHLLGFVNQEGVGYGVQAYQLRIIRGEQVQQWGEVTGDSEPLPHELAGGAAIPYAGADLRLTIDRTVQAYVEGELDKALLEYQAEGGAILVLDPRTGAILAMATRPAYEPQRYPDYAAQGDEAVFQNPAISRPYEPGSVFKVVTLAAALDSGLIDADWSYEDRGSLEYGGIPVYNWDRASYGQQNLQGILAHSLNVGVATLSTRVMGADVFYGYVQHFGFGQPTGVELSNEAGGTVHTPADWDWTDSYLATNAFGQGIAVTPLQMAAAVGALANEGTLMQPYVVAERRYADGRTVRVPPRPAGQPVSAETARITAALMANALEAEVPQAAVPGYRIAGKTGTAQIPGVGGYEPEEVITSFVGFGPLPDPQVLILVKIDRPGIAPELRWGTRTAAPVFQRVAARLFVLLGIPPSHPVAEGGP